jgi:ATP-dependent Clp protease, protease subunit
MEANTNNEFRKYAVKHLGFNSMHLDNYFSGIQNMTRTVIEERPVNFREVDVFFQINDGPHYFSWNTY